MKKEYLQNDSNRFLDSNQHWLLDLLANGLILGHCNSPFWTLLINLYFLTFRQLSHFRSFRFFDTNPIARIMSRFSGDVTIIDDVSSFICMFICSTVISKFQHLFPNPQVVGTREDKCYLYSLPGWLLLIWRKRLLGCFGRCFSEHWNIWVWIVSVIRARYEDVTMKVKVNGRKCEAFNVKVGVHQGFFSQPTTVHHYSGDFV